MLRRAILLATLISTTGLFAAPAAAVTPDEAFAAHRLVRDWISSHAVPTDGAELFESDAQGTSVTLRLDGQIVGRGVAMFEGPEALASATREAWAEASVRLKGERDALQDDRLAAATPRIVVDLEFALTLTPLFGTTIIEAASEVSTGSEGVAVRIADDLDAVFPGAMLSRNASPAESLRSLLSEMHEPLATLEAARNERGLVAYRFDTLRLAQTESGSLPIFLHRGGRLRSIREVTPESIRQMGDRVESHLLSHRWPGEEALGILGTHRPWAGDYDDPMIASARDQAFAALALARWANVRSADDEARVQRVAPAVQLLIDLALVEESESAPDDDAVAAAMIVLATREARRCLGDAQLPFEAESLAFGMQPIVRDAFDVDAGFAEDLRPGEQAVIAAALAAMGEGYESVRMLFRASNPAELPALMPWLGWAALDVWSAEQDLPPTGALMDFRSLVWRHQIRAADVPLADRDLAGGIVFTASRNPAPTAQSLRALAFIATSIGDLRLTTNLELRQEFARHLESLRFLFQLEIGEVESTLTRRPERSVGGVRTSLWDWRLRVDTSAFALLTLAETVNSIQKRTGGGNEADN